MSPSSQALKVTQVKRRDNKDQQCSMSLKADWPDAWLPVLNRSRFDFLQRRPYMKKFLYELGL